MNKLQLVEIIRLTAPAEVANAVSDIVERERRAQVELMNARCDARDLLKSLSHARSKHELFGDKVCCPTTAWNEVKP